jgi:hypothetical protein
MVSVFLWRSKMKTTTTEGKAEAIEVAPQQIKRNAFGAVPVTKGELILTSISVAAFLASFAYTVNWLIIGA